MKEKRQPKKAPTRRKPAHRGNPTPAVDAAEVGVSVEERQRLIEVAAYYRAEQRSFAPGQELEDWLAAETEIDARLTRTFGGAQAPPTIRAREDGPFSGATGPPASSEGDCPIDD